MHRAVLSGESNDVATIRVGPEGTLKDAQRPECVSPVRSDYELLQSTATARAAHTSCMRPSLNLPSRSVSVPTATPSAESRLTADRRGIGSSPGSRSTSLASPRTVVVHGAMSARRSRGIAASRERTTTGRRPIPGSSHHHTSPLAGRSFTRRPPPLERKPGHPMRLPHRGDVRRTHRTLHRSRRRDVLPPTR